MTKQTEALKLALEWDEKRKYIMPYMVRDAIREALASEASEESSGTEQPAQQGHWEEQPDGSMIPVDPSEMQPAQPQQEPVAGMDEMVNRFLAWPLPESVCTDPCTSWPGYSHSRFGTSLLTAIEARQMLEHVFQDTSPPAQRKPLMDEEINAFFQGMEPNNGFWLSFARAIEAAHGIKGGA